MKKNVKDMIWHWKSFRQPERNGVKIEYSNLILSRKDCMKRVKQEHTTAMLAKQLLSTIEDLQNK